MCNFLSFEKDHLDLQLIHVLYMFHLLSVHAAASAVLGSY